MILQSKTTETLNNIIVYKEANGEQVFDSSLSAGDERAVGAPSGFVYGVIATTPGLVPASGWGIFSTQTVVFTVEENAIKITIA